MFLFSFAGLIFSLLLAAPSFAGSGLSGIPSEYGEVIYRYNEKSPSQIFIIGMGHRDALTGLGAANTARVQAEVYKLGEWLIRNEGLELLLPEGFFSSKNAPPKKEAAPEKIAKPSAQDSLDLKTVEGILRDTRTFINAEILLKRTYPLALKQIEDRKLYFAVNDLLRKLVSCGNDPAEYLKVKSELDYFQERRTAAMLQVIPGIINAEYQEGRIKHKKGLFSIGLSHIPMVTRYLQEKKINIYSPLVSLNKNEDCLMELNLREENYGVSILLPRTLSKDAHILKITNLDRIAAAKR